MNNAFDDMEVRFDLSPEQVFDITRVKYVYSILTSRSIFSLNSTDVDSLKLFSTTMGASSVLSRNVLAAALDTIFSPKYYIAGEISPRSEDNNSKVRFPSENVRIYPNPGRDYLQVELNNYNEPMAIRFFDLNGRLIDSFNLLNGLNEINLGDAFYSGIFFYKINSGNKMISQGKLFIIR